MGLHVNQYISMWKEEEVVEVTMALGMRCVANFVKNKPRTIFGSVY
jgi:hypothetical protein